MEESISPWHPQAEPLLVTDDDECFDYCLWPYQPLTSAVGKWHSSNLLRHSFDVECVGNRLYRICEAIQAAVGSGRTVWGIKWSEQGLSWEFYFYDYDRLERSVSVQKLVAALAPYVSCELHAEELRPYFMFSLDVEKSWGEEELSKLEEISLYFGNTGCEVSSGLSYSLNATGVSFDNHYYFFDAKNEQEKIIEKVVCSAHLDLPNIDLEQLLLRPLMACGVIVVANKRHNDGLYFSRINVQQLLFGLKRLNCPGNLIDYIEKHAHQLDYLLFDLGFDYTMKNGELIILKGAYYGTF